MPPGAAEFAVGREFQSDRGLPVHDLLDLHVLDLAQILGRNLALLELRARLLDARRPQQAANLVGAEGGFCSLHGFYSREKIKVIPGWSEGPDPESRDSPMCNCTSRFDAEPVIGPRFARTRWHRPGMTVPVALSYRQFVTENWYRSDADLNGGQTG